MIPSASTSKSATDYSAPIDVSTPTPPPPPSRNNDRPTDRRIVSYKTSRNAERSGGREHRDLRYVYLCTLLCTRGRRAYVKGDLGDATLAVVFVFGNRLPNPRPHFVYYDSVSLKSAIILANAKRRYRARSNDFPSPRHPCPCASSVYILKRYSLLPVLSYVRDEYILVERFAGNSHRRLIVVARTPLLYAETRGEMVGGEGEHREIFSAKRNEPCRPIAATRRI